MISMHKVNLICEEFARNLNHKQGEKKRLFFFSFLFFKVRVLAASEINFASIVMENGTAHHQIKYLSYVINLLHVQ